MKNEESNIPSIFLRIFLILLISNISVFVLVAETAAVSDMIAGS